MATATVSENSRNRQDVFQPYVLVTPARNEAAFIEKVIESVIHQTVLPAKWVIVDDGSTDDTAAIVGRYLESHPWIELVQMPQRRDRSFAAKVGAFNAGYEKVKDVDYEVLGNLDADISFDANYIELLLSKFEEDARLGVAGTVFQEEGYSSERQSFEGQNHVAGGCQMFRKACFDAVGGFIPNKAGGVPDEPAHDREGGLERSRLHRRGRQQAGRQEREIGHAAQRRRRRARHVRAQA